MPEKTYELAVAAPVALAEWIAFAQDDGFVRALGEVRFDTAGANHSRLAIRTREDSEPLRVDAVVQRFRDRLARKHLLES
jgi:hypothetical protein